MEKASTFFSIFLIFNFSLRLWMVYLN